MLKKPCVRTLMGSQYVEESETLLISAMEKFCNIFWSLWKNFSSINSLLVVTEIMKLLVNVLTP